MSHPDARDDARGSARPLAAQVTAAGLVGLAVARWAVMSSAAPYRAVLPASWMSGEAIGLTRVAANAAACVVFLVALPWFVLRWRDARDGCFSEWKGMIARGGLPGRGWFPWLAASCAAVAIAALAVRVSPTIGSAYPIYRGACERFDAAALLAETAYAVVIVATELFYRGALLVAFRSTMGRKALLAMAVVCAFDHVGAPWIELATSGLGALVLGWIALRTRSVWPGCAVHLSLALGIDAASCMALLR